MKIAIIGATARTGIELLKQTGGYKVQVLVRDKSKLPEGKYAKIVEGSVLDGSAVGEVVKGVDAVIWLVGHRKDSEGDMLVRGMRNTLEAMKKHKVKRIIALTGAGVRSHKDNPKLADKVIRGVMQVMVGKMLKDAVAMADLLRESDREWTLVRAPRLTDEKATGKNVIGYLGDKDLTTQMTRADTARVILEILKDKSYVGEDPAMSNGK